MATSPEVKAKKQILDALKATCAGQGYTLDLETHAGDAFSTPTLDITGTIKIPTLDSPWGVPFAIEVKRFDGKGKLTERQAHTIRKKHAAGVAVFLIDTPAALDGFLWWLLQACPWRPCPDV